MKKHEASLLLKVAALFLYLIMPLMKTAERLPARRPGQPQGLEMSYDVKPTLSFSLLPGEQQPRTQVCHFQTKPLREFLGVTGLQLPWLSRYKFARKRCRGSV